MKDIEIVDYNEGELVRLELLQYPNPEGLHKVEEAWRNLCRKLMKHTDSLQQIVKNHHNGYVRVEKNGDCNCCPSNFKEYIFPKPFEPVVGNK